MKKKTQEKEEKELCLCLSYNTYRITSFHNIVGVYIKLMYIKTHITTLQRLPTLKGFAKGLL